MFNPVAPYRYLLSNLYLSVVDIANPDLFVCGIQTWISLDRSAQYLARCLEPGNLCHSITTRETHKKRMKEALFTRHHNTVEPMMLADQREATLQAIHTDAVIMLSKDQKNYIVLDDLPHPINGSEQNLTRKERATLTQLRSGYCKLLGSYMNRIKKTLVVKHAAPILFIKTPGKGVL